MGLAKGGNLPNMGNLLGMVWESIGDLKGIIGSLYAMVSSFSRGPKTCKSKAKVPLRAAFRDGVPCGGSRDVWIEKLLEPYACNAEFVVHVASLCAVTWHGLAVKFCREQVPTMGHTTSCRLQTSSNAWRFLQLFFLGLPAHHGVVFYLPSLGASRAESQVPQLSPQKPQEQQDIFCKESEQTSGWLGGLLIVSSSPGSYQRGNTHAHTHMHIFLVWYYVKMLEVGSQHSIMQPDLPDKLAFFIIR